MSPRTVVELAWGPAGAASLAADCTHIVVVDVLPVTTCGVAVVAALPAGSEMLVLGASLRNASAVARRLTSGAGRVGLVATGEWTADGGWRPAYEDLLGAGAVVAGLLAGGPAECSPAVTAALAAYTAAREDLVNRLAASRSGVELAARGLSADIALAADYDVDDAVPVLEGGQFVAR